MQADRLSGTVVRIVDGRGYGFIRGADGAEYFVHASALGRDEDFGAFLLGATVEFTAVQETKGWRAEAVRVLP